MHLERKPQKQETEDMAESQTFSLKWTNFLLAACSGELTARCHE